MTREEMMQYEEARMTHGQRYQAAQDWKAAQHVILAGLVVICWAVAMIEPLML